MPAGGPRPVILQNVDPAEFSRDLKHPLRQRTLAIPDSYAAVEFGICVVATFFTPPLGSSSTETEVLGCTAQLFLEALEVAGREAQAVDLIVLSRDSCSVRDAAVATSVARLCTATERQFKELGCENSRICVAKALSESDGVVGDVTEVWENSSLPKPDCLRGGPRRLSVRQANELLFESCEADFLHRTVLILLALYLGLALAWRVCKERCRDCLSGVKARLRFE